MEIVPILLCGGSGTRLWPLSRQSYPKQFVPLVGEETLFQASARRVSGGSESISFAPPLVLTHSDFRFIVTEQLQEIGLDPGPVLLEPEGRNTAPAILAAALQACSMDADQDPVLLIAPSDHMMPDRAAFHEALRLGVEAVSRGQLVTFGITPTHAETAYGYLDLAEPPSPSGGAVPLRGFVEKPDRAQAQKMLAAGHFKWNAGIFLCRASDLIAAYERHAPALMAPVIQALEEATSDLGFLRLAPEPWSRVEHISIDYAVMEKTDTLSVVPFDAAWSDLGGWDAVWRETQPDPQGVVAHGDATAIECRDTLLRSDSDQLEIIGIGLEGIMAVAMNDAVLVADMSRAQDVKQAVSALKAKGVPQATNFPKDHRPWGWFEKLVVGERFQVKRIFVYPGASLSLQSHVHRSEHWVVVKGTARVTVEDDVKLLTENQSVYIPLGAVHRMENPGKVPMVLIEVQTGAYVGEDDILRYEDRYARG